MNDGEYLNVQAALMAFSAGIKTLDIEGFLARIGQCETVAPIVDPTLYCQGRGPLAKITRIAQAARAFQRKVAE
ncbi:MAG: hypothetical protein KAV00_01900 [Phycisphaerae bacterium]|nr:hypothetical protein [Phycisphaerae bacterium]